MKIDFVSDLHLDTWQPEQTWTWLKTRKSDYLLIAGDTSDYIEHPQKTDLYESLIHLGNNYKHVYFIDGNHEFQPNRLNVEEIKEDIIECIDPLDNVHYIPVQENMKDYVRDYQDMNMKNVAVHEAEKTRAQKLDDFFAEIQTPVLVCLLYFIFQTPYLNKVLFKKMSFLQIYNSDGNFNLYGLIFKSLLFGTSYYGLYTITNMLSEL